MLIMNQTREEYWRKNPRQNGQVPTLMDAGPLGELDIDANHIISSTEGPDPWQVPLGSGAQHHGHLIAGLWHSENFGKTLVRK